MWYIVYTVHTYKSESSQVVTIGIYQIGLMTSSVVELLMDSESCVEWVQGGQGIIRLPGPMSARSMVYPHQMYDIILGIDMSQLFMYTIMPEGGAKKESILPEHEAHFSY